MRDWANDRLNIDVRVKVDCGRNALFREAGTMLVYAPTYFGVEFHQPNPNELPEPHTVREAEIVYEGVDVGWVDELYEACGLPDRPRCIAEGVAGMKACPFVYSRPSEREPWVEQGTILTHQVGLRNERTQRLPLNGFSGEVLIRELDPEVSYFDSMAVEVTYRDGSRESLLPTRPELVSIDGSYLVTQQGDEVVVRFEEPRDRTFVTAMLSAYGYYVPFDSVLGETTRRNSLD